MSYDPNNANNDNVSGQAGADELWEQSGRKLSQESSDRATSPRAALGRQFAGAGESKFCQENVVTDSLKCCQRGGGYIPMHHAVVESVGELS